MNKKLLLSIGLILLVIIVVIVTGFFGDDSPYLTEGEQDLTSAASIEEGFIEAEQLINARAPIQIDEQTQLNKAVAGPGNRMTYFYSLTDIETAATESTSVIDDLKPKVTSSLCNNAEMQPVLQAGAQVIYVYSSNQGNEIGRISITAADC